jgi:hypothetical protein
MCTVNGTNVAPFSPFIPHFKGFYLFLLVLKWEVWLFGVFSYLIIGHLFPIPVPVMPVGAIALFVE